VIRHVAEIIEVAASSRSPRASIWQVRDLGLDAGVGK
jgi:hypothetical protein